MHKRKRPFASILHAVLIALLVISLILIAQQFSLQIYQLGLIILGAAAITQIGFGNVPPGANFTQSIKFLVLTYVIVGAVFVAGILLAPTLIGMARG